jgi:hypothetical protein
VNETSDYVLSTRASTPSGSRLIEVKAVGDDSGRQQAAVVFGQQGPGHEQNRVALSPSKKHSVAHSINGNRSLHQ